MRMISGQLFACFRVDPRSSCFVTFGTLQRIASPRTQVHGLVVYRIAPVFNRQAEVNSLHSHLVADAARSLSEKLSERVGIAIKTRKY